MVNRSGGASTGLIALVITAWVAVVITPPAILAWWRVGRLATLSDPTIQADWTVFRDAMKKQSDRSGPVQRKVPKSVEPPELVWLRDYFWLAVAAWIVLGGTLGGFLGIAVLGVAGSRMPSGPGSSGP